MDLVRYFAQAVGVDLDATRPCPPSDPEPSPSEPVEEPPLVVHGAYHPRDRGMAHGSQHLVTTRPLDAGRLHRKPGDALCKPATKFWGLNAHPEREASCKRCIKIGARLGLVAEKGGIS
jgi:hypothetical protein